jgi:drug/metabolite transporter (DMT)-like permease
MNWLIGASAIWGLSFGLIKGKTGHIDPFFLSCARLLLAFLFSLAFYRPSDMPNSKRFRLAAVGALQLGFMYAPYLFSFRYLKAYEVALFTMLTPVFVAGIYVVQKKSWNSTLFFATSLAIVGGLIAAWKPLASDLGPMLIGFGLVQISNLLFAFGQSLLFQDGTIGTQKSPLVGVPFYFSGAFAASLICYLVSHLIQAGPALGGATSQDLLVIAWLGIVSSGVGFLIWNWGVIKVNVSQLAVASDIKLPIAVLISVFVFLEPANLLQLSMSLVVLTSAAVLARKSTFAK